MTEPKILFIGPGAIGGSVAAWVAENYPATFVMGRGAALAALRQNGLTTYRFDAPDATRRTVHPTIVDRPGAVADAAIVVLAVKNYSLESVAQQMKDELGDRPIVVSIANGIDNQGLLPKLFSKVVYGIASYNARREAPGVIGYQHKLPLLIGTIDTAPGAEVRLVQSVLGRGCPTEIVERMQDAIHTKIVVNLTNALDALVGRGALPLSNPEIFQRLLTQTLWEGVRAIRAAGHREYRVPGMPSFAFLHLAATLPEWLTRPLFRRRLRAMRMSSMTQDVMQHGAQATELESITGYIVDLAAQHGVPAPYNRAILKLGRERFRPGFTPMMCEEVMAAVEREVAG
jgi:2-dehydropantoate 2-reductase